MFVLIPISKLLKTKNYINAVGRWSYSKLSVYDVCPRQFRHQYIDKIGIFVKSPAMERGLKIHDIAEKFVLGKRKTIPKELSIYENEFFNLRKAGGTKEIDYSFTKQYTPSEWNDWDNVWCIAKLDATCPESKHELNVIDYKTGQIYDTHKSQGEVYALSAFIHNPKIEFVNVEFWYLDLPEDEPGIWHYDKEQHFDRLKHYYAKKAKIIFEDRKFKKKPSYKCNWCDFNVKKGGVCNPDA